MSILITSITNYPKFKSTVAEWYKSFWGSRYPERTLNDWIASLEKNSVEPSFTFIAIDQSQTPAVVVGTTCLKFQGMGEYKPDQPWLSAVFVPEEYRGRKIATRLIQAVIKKISEKKFTDLYLFTRTNGHIYETLGWRSIPEKNEFQGTPVITMKRRLAPPMRLTPIQNITFFQCMPDASVKAAGRRYIVSQP